jgi:hypothetical protein
MYPQTGSYQNLCGCNNKCNVACTCNSGGSCSSNGDYCEQFTNSCSNGTPQLSVYQCSNNLNDHDGVDGVDYTILLKHFENHGVGDITQNGGKDH